MDYSKTPASPYAAPHTPIASSKRPRINTTKMTIKTPIRTPNIASISKTPERSENHTHHEHDNEDQELAHKHKNRLHMRPVEPPTPSKNLFSPSLRETDENKFEGLHTHDEEEAADSSGDFDLDRSDCSSEVPEEEVKRQPSGETSEDMEEDEDEDVFNPYHFIGHLPEYHLVAEKNKLCLPPANHSDITLVLDLDETLVHCTVEPIQKPDLIFPVEFNGTTYQVYVRKRPYLDYFLETIAKSFEVVLFTASQKVYADVLLDKLDPQRQFINHRLFRESCLFVQGNYLKDLCVLGRDLKKTVLVDNSPHAYAYQINNGIPIESWYDDEQDSELLKLIGFLKRLHGSEDVRPMVREQFKTFHLVNRAKNGLPVSLKAPSF